MYSDVMAGFRMEAERELTGNILPFWLRYAVDRRRGGFFGLIHNDLRVEEEAPRGLVLCARLLWTMAMAWRRFGRAEYRDAAAWFFAYLSDKFWDQDDGGFFWMVDAAGRPVDPRKRIYGQAFAVYALAEYFLAGGGEESLVLADRTFDLIEEHSRDRKARGYFEAYTRDWRLESDRRPGGAEMNRQKSMNTHLHILEAYTNLAGIRKDGRVMACLKELLGVFLEKIIDPATGHYGLFFDENWTSRTSRFSFGHDLEGAWLLDAAAGAIGDAALTARAEEAAVRAARLTLAEGVDADGGVFYEGSPAGIVNADKEWWPQAEAVVGFLEAYRLTGAEEFFAAALRTWRFIQENLADRERGEWFGRIRGGRADWDYPRVSPWKCPYHNARCCAEIMRRMGEGDDRGHGMGMDLPGSRTGAKP